MDTKKITDREFQKSSRAAKLFYRTINRLSTGFLYASCLVLLLIAGLLLFSIINRLFQIGIVGTQAFSQILGVWLTFLVIPYLALTDRHITVTYFYNRAPKRVQQLLDGFNIALSLSVAAVLTMSGISAVNRFKDSTPTTLDFSLSYFYGAIMLGAGLLVLVYVFNGLNYLYNYSRLGVKP